MTEPRSSQGHLTVDRLTVVAYRPRLGDLAADLAKDHRVGVVVGLPGEFAKSYHLRVPDGEGSWRAKGDGSTLRPVSVRLSPAVYNDGAENDGSRTTDLPISVSHGRGSTAGPSPVLTSEEAAGRDLAARGRMP